MEITKIYYQAKIQILSREGAADISENLKIL